MSVISTLLNAVNILYISTLMTVLGLLCIINGAELTSTHKLALQHSHKGDVQRAAWVNCHNQQTNAKNF